MIYCSPSPGVETRLGTFPGLALFDLMKPYMPPSPRNLERLHRDIHHRRVEMWAGCIWAPIYEVMSRKRLTIVTLEENLPMARDIGMNATTSLEAAFEEAMARHGAGREGGGATVRALPDAGRHDPDAGVAGPPCGGGGLNRARRHALDPLIADALARRRGLGKNVERIRARPLDLLDARHAIHRTPQSEVPPRSGR